jgi:acyl-coenzyme A synthetase/AMP-(fatty) acid ligase
MHFTGDLAYLCEDGLFYFMGRKDSQIKLNGYRIELGEVEGALSSIQDVESACVLFDPENQEIVAFIQSQIPFTLAKLRRQLFEKIPKYMLPARLDVMEALPLTPNGKIDREALRRNCL